MTAVLLAFLAGACFGGLAVAFRVGLSRNPDAPAAALVSISTALGACAITAIATGSSFGEPGDLWPYVVAGLLAPGVSHPLFVGAVRDIGSARAAILVGTAPLLSAMLAIVFLDEPLRAGLVLGTILIVIGGILLAREPDRPAAFKLLGAALAIGAATFFAVRDNVVRWAAGEASLDAFAAATVILAAGGLAYAAYLLLRRGRALAPTLRRAFPPFAPAGIIFGLAYGAMLEAFARGEVTIVAPLIATESLWAVFFSAIVLGAAEYIGRQVVLAALVVVGGSVLIGAVVQ